MLRSMLFVPGDSDRKMAKAREGTADALILDLEDSVAKDRLPAAREMVRDYLKAERERGRQQLWVRINPLDTSFALGDLAAVMAGAPDGIVLPKPDSAADVIQLGHYLDALEAREGLPAGATRILSVATETPRTFFTFDSYVGASDRLYGMTWGAEDLSAALGATTNRAPSGEYDDPFRLARSLCLAACKAAGVEAVGAVYPDFRDLDGLGEEARYDRRGGFSGKIAIHPAQVPVINDAFTPSAEEVAFARKVIKVFADNPGAGTIGFEGKMLDMPHLKQARHVVAAYEAVRRR